MYIDVQKRSGKVTKLTVITFGKEEERKKISQLSKGTCVIFLYFTNEI